MVHYRPLGFGVLLLLLMAAVPAYAYIDPGSGSLMMQAAIGIVTGLLAAIGLYWSRLRQAVSQLRARLRGRSDRQQ